LPKSISCKYLFLREISEPNDNRLRLIVEEANAGEIEPGARVVAGVPFSDLRPIESSHNDRLFELIWSSYIAYSIRNESFVSLDSSEVVEAGRLICVYSKSHFLDYVAKATSATDEYPGKSRHLGINCLNHIVDIVSIVEPEVRLLRPIQFRSSQVQIH
jgi:hypothetical protein